MTKVSMSELDADFKRADEEDLRLEADGILLVIHNLAHRQTGQAVSGKAVGDANPKPLSQGLYRIFEHLKARKLITLVAEDTEDGADQIIHLTDTALAEVECIREEGRGGPLRGAEQERAAEWEYMLAYRRTMNNHACDGWEAISLAYEPEVGIVVLMRRHCPPGSPKKKGGKKAAERMRKKQS